MPSGPRLQPNADVTTGWGTIVPASPTTHFDKVDETIAGADDATSYVQTTTEGEVERYDFITSSIDQAQEVGIEIRTQNNGAGTGNDILVELFVPDTTSLGSVSVPLVSDAAWTTTKIWRVSGPIADLLGAPDVTAPVGWAAGPFSGTDLTEAEIEITGRQTGMPSTFNLRITAIDLIQGVIDLPVFQQPPIIVHRVTIIPSGPMPGGNL